MPFKKLLVSQGRYDYMVARYGSVQAVAERMAAYDIIVLSHIADVNDTLFPTICGCADRGEPLLPEILAAVRYIKPNIEVFGYVSATADAPSGCGYGDSISHQHEHGTNPWLPAGGVCNNFIYWAKKWNDLNLTGLKLDLVADQYISPAVRDNIYSWCRLKGYKIMANSTYPSQTNVNFAAVGLGLGDYLMVEGFRYGLCDLSQWPTVIGDTLPGTNAALTAINSKRNQRFAMAAMCTMKWDGNVVGQETNPNHWTNANGKSMLTNFGVSGDAYYYGWGSLGIGEQTIPLPPF